MGGGKHEDQVDQRFDQGSSEWTKEKERCGGTDRPFASYGPYELRAGEEGIEIRADGEILGVYPGYISLKEDRALLELDKGTLLEISEGGIREILSPEKTLLLSFIASDGNIRYTQERPCYQLRFGSKSDELRGLFRESMETAYDLTPGEYRHKDKEHFFEMITSSKEAAADAMKHINKHGSDYWEVPSRYMDKEAARAWLKGFMSGDGSIGYYPNFGGLSVRFCSKYREGLEEIAQLLDGYFGIESRIYPREKELDPKRGKYELCINKNEHQIRFVAEIGSYKRSHQEAIDRFFEDRWKRFHRKE